MLESTKVNKDTGPSLLRKIADHPTTVGSVLKTMTLVGFVGGSIYYLWTRPEQVIEEQEPQLWEKIGSYLWNYGLQTVSGMYVAYNRRWYNSTVSKLEQTSLKAYDSLRIKLANILPGIVKNESDPDLMVKANLFHALSEAVESFDEAPVGQLFIQDKSISLSQQELKCFLEYMRQKEELTVDSSNAMILRNKI